MPTANAAAPSARAWPSVSVVVINYNGRDYLERCIASLRALDYPAESLEIVLIDNASTDGSVEAVREAHGDAVRIIVNGTNTGFSPAVNQGAREATGTYLALLNNDAEADPGWLREAVRVLEAEERVACVASKILRDDRTTIDYAGGQMAFYGHGFAAGNDEPDDPTGDIMRPTLFASGGAMVTPRALFLDVGGFDESFFAFYEDVDLGWRLWLYGYEVRYVPTSRVFHRHHGTIERFGYPRERYLLERNALRMLVKNYSDENLARVLPGAIALSLLRGLADDPDRVPDFRITGDTTPIADVPLTPVAGASVAAIRDWGLDLHDTLRQRAEVQSRRVVSDRQVVGLFERALLPNHPDRDFLQVFHTVVEGFRVEEAMRAKGRVLIITADHLGKRMAGPAIRCWEMARVLSAEHDVVLATTRPTELTSPDFTVEEVDDARLKALLDDTDLVIFQGFIMYFHPAVMESGLPLLVDIYDPFHLEGLELRRFEDPYERFATARSDVQVLNEQLERGDFFVCASEKQRDFWLGQMSAIGRINPSTYDEDASLRQLLDVAPFGLPSEPPKKRRDVLKGVVDGIGPDDFVLLWGGGIYNWFDPLTLIRALDEVGDDAPDVKLFFLGSAHPNPDVPKMRMAAAAHALADELGLLGTRVVFNPGWVEYEERADYLLESDVGVSTHFDHVETAYSYRTRILDYLWAGLPILATEGDSLSRLVHRHDLGLTVPAEDVKGLASALRRLRNDRDFYDACAANVRALAPEMTWEKALAPIVEFARMPRRAADAALDTRPALLRGDVTPLRRTPGYYARRAGEMYRELGPKRTAEEIRAWFDRKLR
jgi:GT2 family glycosyltransferase